MAKYVKEIGQSYLQHKKNKKAQELQIIGVTPEFVTNFFVDSSNYIKESAQGIADIKVDNVEQKYTSVLNGTNSYLKQLDLVKDYLDLYGDKKSDDYLVIIQGLNKTKNHLNDIFRTYRAKNNTLSKYKTQEEYENSNEYKVQNALKYDYELFIKNASKIDPIIEFSNLLNGKISLDSPADEKNALKIISNYAAVVTDNPNEQNKINNKIKKLVSNKNDAELKQATLDVVLELNTKLKELGYSSLNEYEEEKNRFNTNVQIRSEVIYPGYDILSKNEDFNKVVEEAKQNSKLAALIDGDIIRTKYLTKFEKDYLYYIGQKNGFNVAISGLKALDNARLQQKEYNDKMQTWQEWASENTFNAVLSALGNIAYSNTAGAFINTAAALSGFSTNRFLRENTDKFMKHNFGNLIEAASNAGREMIVGDNKAAGVIYDFFYNLIDQTARLGVACILGGTTDPKVLSALSGKISGVNVGSKAMYEAQQNGATVSRALVQGILQGLSEALPEKYSLDKILTSDKSLKSFVIGTFSEFVGESTTSTMSQVFDLLVMGDKSNLAENFEEYKKDGLSEKEALIKTLQGAVEQIGYEGFLGALVGAGMSGSKYISGNKGNSAKAKKQFATIGANLRETQNQADINDFIEYVAKMDSDFLENLEKKNGQYTDEALGRVYQFAVQKTQETFFESEGVKDAEQRIIAVVNKFKKAESIKDVNVIKERLVYELLETNEEISSISDTYGNNKLMKSAVSQAFANELTMVEGIAKAAESQFKEQNSAVQDSTNQSINDIIVQEGDIYGEEVSRAGNGNTSKQGRGSDYNSSGERGTVLSNSKPDERDGNESENWDNTLRVGENQERRLTPEQLSKVERTAIKDENGNPIQVYHFTSNMDFEIFNEGDIGFHFGSIEQAQNRGKSKKQNGRIITAILNIENPLRVNQDIMCWKPAQTAVVAYAEKIISEEQWNAIVELSKKDDSYNSEAAQMLRELFAEKGYDGIAYKNMFEGEGDSYIAFYPEQVIILDDGRGLDSNNDGTAEIANDIGDVYVDDDVYNKSPITDRSAQPETVGELTPQMRTIIQVGKALGYEVNFGEVFTKSGKPAAAKVNGNKITFNYNAKRPIEFLLKHEITHSLENLEGYSKFQNTVMESLYFSDWVNRKGYKNIFEMRDAIIENRINNGDENFLDKDSVEQERKANNEITANFVGDVLFGGEKSLEGFVESLTLENRKGVLGWLQKLFERIRDKITGYKYGRSNQFLRNLDKELAAIQKNFTELFQSAKVNTQQKTTDEGGNSYSIVKDSKNRDIVILDRNIFNNITDLKKRGEALEDWIIKNFGGQKYNTSDFHFILVNERTAGKMKFWNENMDEAAYKIKLSVAEHIDELIKLAKHDRHRHNYKDKHKEFAKHGWDYFKAYFTDGTRVYMADMSTAKTDNGSVLYNIGQIDDVGAYNENKKNSYSLTGSPNELVTIPNDRATNRNSNDSIPNSPENVNSKYSVDDESIEYLLDEYKAGNISKQEFIEQVGSKAPETFRDIADLKEEDASSTPPKKPKKPLKNDVEYGKGNSKFYKTVQKSGIITDDVKTMAQDDKFVEHYQCITNRGSLIKAANTLDTGGKEYTEKWFSINPKKATPENIAEGILLFERYQANGDISSATAVIERLREMGTAAGQAVQMFSIMGRFSPDMMVAYAQRELSGALKVMQEKKTQKWIDNNKERFKLTDEDIEFIRRRVIQAANMPDGRPRDILLAEISARIQNKIPPKAGDSIKAYQRTCMLLNPKSNIRNIVGNASTLPEFIFADVFGAAVDKLITNKTNTYLQKNDMEGTAQRTKTLFSFKGTGNAFLKGAHDAYEDFRLGINTRNPSQNKYDYQAGKAYNDKTKYAAVNAVAKALNMADRLTGFLLDLGDRPFYEMWFMNSLNGQMKANKVSEPTKEMVEIATNEALQRTWQDDNRWAKTVTKLKDTMNVVNLRNYGLGDIMLKFTKTPANLSKALFDFSPAGLVKSLSVDLRKYAAELSKGNYDPTTQKKVVDSISKGIAGTLTNIMVYALCKMGWLALTGEGDEDKDVAAFEKYILGKPNYSFSIFGSTYTTYDWAQPIGGFVATIANYMQSKEKNPDNDIFENLLVGLTAGGNVLCQQSFLKTLETFFNSNNEDIVERVFETVFSDASVYIPQLIAQLASVTDDKQRIVYTGSFKEETINAIKNKIPGLRQTLTPEVDIFGNEIVNSRNDVYNAFINPGNVYTDTSDEVSRHVYDVYKATGDKSAIPPKAPNSISVKGTSYPLTAEQKSEFQSIRGQTLTNIIEDAMDLKEYENLSDESKVKFMKKAQEYSTAFAKTYIMTSYEVLSSVYTNLTKEKYDNLTDKQRTTLAQEYFMDDYLDKNGVNNIKTSVAEYLLNKLEESASKTTAEERFNTVLDRVTK